jgi:DNA-binding NarL/FixJ family response regulator
MSGSLQREDGVAFHTPRIVIADDFETLRRGLRSLIGPAVCGEAANGQEAVQKVLELHPDLVILDVGMPVMNGLDASRAIRRVAPQVKILVFSLHDEKGIREQARAAGADAFLPKTALGDKILGTIEQLLAPLELAPHDGNEQRVRLSGPNAS